MAKRCIALVSIIRCMFQPRKRIRNCDSGNGDGIRGYERVRFEEIPRIVAYPLLSGVSVEWIECFVRESLLIDVSWESYPVLESVSSKSNVPNT